MTTKEEKAKLGKIMVIAIYSRRQTCKIALSKAETTLDKKYWTRNLNDIQKLIDAVDL